MDVDHTSPGPEVSDENVFCQHPLAKALSGCGDLDDLCVAVEFECDGCCKKASNAHLHSIGCGFLSLAPCDSTGILIRAVSGGCMVESETAQFMVIDLDRVCSVEVQEHNPTPPDGGPPSTGPLTTGPFFVRTGQNNAINVKVQNTGNTPIDADVKLFSLDCPACNPVDSRRLANIAGGCCVKDAALSANAGNFEAVVCPIPANAPIRAFVSVHSGNAVTSSIEYTIKAAEMLSPVCSFCQEDDGICPAAKR
ncbi:MAG: hypothetical protein VB144_09880 [Clostridia bacterium]|nr:hypothetical protein [Clostridia bacterium]